MRKEVETHESAALLRPRTRREILKFAALGLGATAGASLFTREASAQDAEASSDIEILNFAFINESFEAEVFYPVALDAGILSGEEYEVIAQIQQIEVVHRDALAAAIVGLGGTLAPVPEFFVPEEILASQQIFLETALVQEQKDLGFNLTAGPLIYNPDVLAAAGAISGSEAENLTAVKYLLGFVPPANEPFPAAVPLDEAFATLAPYIVGVGASSSASSSSASSSASSSGSSSSSAAASSSSRNTLPATGGIAY